MEKRSSSKRLKKKRESRRVDTTIVVLMILFALISILTVFATTYLQYDGGASLNATLTHGLWYVIGAVAAIVVMQLDRKTLYDFAPIAYIAGLLLLVLVLIFYDRDLALSNGARSWFALGPFSFQPSELMKIAYILMMARLVDGYIQYSDKNQYTKLPLKERIQADLRFLTQLAIWTIPPVLLIILQNDLGTTLVFLIIFLGAVFVSGITWHLITPSFLLMAALGILLLFLVIYNRDFLLAIGFQDYQFARIDSWLEPFGNTANESYQLAQSLKAIGSGGMTGKGFGIFEVYVPVRESDMIFATIGENFGFLGSSFIILLYFLLIFQMVAIAFQTHDGFYVAIVAGIVSMYTFHIFENIGMSIGLLPLTGIPLPFLSMGGTALVTNMMCIGLILSIKFHWSTPEEKLQRNPIIKSVRTLNKGVNYDRIIRA